MFIETQEGYRGQGVVDLGNGPVDAFVRYTTLPDHRNRTSVTLRQGYLYEGWKFTIDGHRIYVTLSTWSISRGQILVPSERIPHQMSEHLVVRLNEHTPEDTRIFFPTIVPTLQEAINLYDCLGNICTKIDERC